MTDLTGTTRRRPPFRSNKRLALLGMKKGSGLFEDALCFVVPSLSCIEVNLIGRMFITELALLCLLPFLILRRGALLKDKLPRMVLLLGAAWFASQVITDLIRNVQMDDLLRGWAKIAFTIINFSALYLLMDRKPRRFVLYSAGMATGFLLQTHTTPDPGFGVDPWKFGYSYPFTSYGVVAAVFIQNLAAGRWIAPAVLIILGVVNFYMGTRSVGLTLFMGAGLLLFKDLGRNFLAHHTKLVIVAAVILGCVGLWGVIQGYEYAAASGFLGPDAQEKYETQTSGDLPLILSGRPEIVGAVMAIADSPILGHGSWAKDKEYVIQLMETMQRLGVEFRIDTKDDPEYSELIPSHSHLFGAWVEAGVLGAVFWTFALVITGRALLVFLTSERNWLDPLIVQSILEITWTILFSPYGAQQRFFTPFLLVFLIWVVQLQRSQTRAPSANFQPLRKPTRLPFRRPLL
jgi:hypothetical protein